MMRTHGQETVIMSTKQSKYIVVGVYNYDQII